MKKEDYSIARIQRAIDEIQKELDKHSRGLGEIGNPTQLKKIINLFEDALAKIKSDKIPKKENRSLGIGRMVVDSWPLFSELGETVIEAEKSYENI